MTQKDVGAKVVVRGQMVTVVRDDGATTEYAKVRSQPSSSSRTVR